MSRPPFDVNLYLVGFMATGKSTFGRMVAMRMGMRFIDVDAEIERAEHMPISRIFETRGEPAFRELERELLRQMASWSGVVIATGGGLAAQPGNLDQLKKLALVVCLWASPETIWERVRHQDHRPLLKTPDPQARIRPRRRRRHVARKEQARSEGG